VHLRSYGLTIACPLSSRDRRVVPFLILAFRRVLASAYHWCELAANFYPTVKAALRHENADSEEDHKGLGCHLGQGLCILVHKLRSDCQPKSDFVHIRI